MRRFLLALTGTIAGLAALLGLKGLSSAAPTAGPVAAAGSSVSTTPGGGAGAGSANGGNANGGNTNGSGAAAGSGTGGGGGAAAGGGTDTTRTVTGSAIATQYGPMQVQVSIAGRKLTAVKVLQHTNSGEESQQIDANAIPQLTHETLAAQSANISAVSGASYTSDGYIKSLQSALDQAGA
jgi:hypothetical protein